MFECHAVLLGLFSGSTIGLRLQNETPHGGRRMIIERSWSMPNSLTFSIKPIKLFLEEEILGSEWCDPFARNSTLAKYTNDLNKNTKAKSHVEALQFLKSFEDESLDGVLFDPPYSPRQMKEVYDSIGIHLKDTKSSVWTKWKEEIARIVKPGGRVISFGWNSGGIGKNLGFKIQRILLVAHGGSHNDTICTLEIKGEYSNFNSTNQTKLELIQ